MKEITHLMIMINILLNNINMIKSTSNDDDITTTTTTTNNDIEVSKTL
jgi:hypothetical protein